ncbi:MAG: MBL fold metallo-hydrolase [Acidobacteria bacterium]|nr:MAG: MBL fold metallo-hydrolase [Acidobacteriota bacterium]
MNTLRFLGATRTVTGSKHLITTGKSRILIDCGLFQGLKELRLKNWEPFPADVRSLDAVVLTHAHIDHTGYLPRLVKDGFRGPIYASSSTIGLCRILLPDTGRLQEEDARYVNKKGFSKHKPALPLFTESEARSCLRYFRPLPFYEPVKVAPKISVCLGQSGHILGSAFIQVTLGRNGTEGQRVVFSGDLGRSSRPIINDPAPPFEADYLVLESTYGDRQHPPQDAKAKLRDVIIRTAERGGTVVIPSFAVGRMQELLYLLTELRERNQIPEIPIFLDSPMAISATAEYLAHTEEHDAEMRARMDGGIETLLKRITVTRSQNESKRAIKHRGPGVILSSSGMAVGGRVLHHLATRLPDARNTILFVGYQAAGTRGRLLVEGAKEIKIYGELIPVNAEIVQMEELSAHADYQEILCWLSNFTKPPRRTFLVHGEESACEALTRRIQDQLGWDCRIPVYGEEVELSADPLTR